MCLIVNKENCKAKVAEKDIICYKLMYGYCNDNKEIRIITPYQLKELPFNEPIVAEGRATKHPDEDDANQKLIGQGVIHSYSALDGAVDDMIGFGDGNIIFKAIIPKGTKYYEGDFDGTPAYGSKKLIITDVIAGTSFDCEYDDEAAVVDYLYDNYKVDCCIK